MKRISVFKFNVATFSIVCFIGLSSCFQQSTMADVISSTGTVTGFANESGGFGDNENPPSAFTIELTGLGTNAEANGFLDLTTFGDFSNAFEYIDISIEGVSLGRLWDNDSSNDSFVGNNADNDRGQEYGEGFSGEITNESAVAVLSESQLDTFLADGVLTISFDGFGAEVNNLVNEIDEFITATVTLNEPTASSVPEPSSCLIVTFVGMLGMARRKRNV